MHVATSLIEPQWTVAMPSVKALMTTRHGGVSEGAYGDPTGRDGLNLGVHVGDRLENVLRNRALLQSRLPAEPAWLTQVHGDRVVDAAGVAHAPEADASVTDRPGVVCAIMTADCLPVLLADVTGKVIGAAHAGWRGLAGGILARTIAQMRSAGADNIQAWLGPAIGPAKFEVGDDVRQAFIAHDGRLVHAFAAIPERDGKYLADIYALARKVLAEDSVTMVTGGDACTVSDAERFYSFRRDGVTGRMAALIWRDD